MAELRAHQHGKNKVRVGRVWREGNVHYLVEWSVHVMLESDMAHAFLTHSNKGMTATDTQKNTVRLPPPRATTERHSTPDQRLNMARSPLPLGSA